MQPWMTIGETSRRSGWSPRMLRYLEQEGLVVPGAQRRGLPPLRHPRAEPAERARASCARASASSSAELEFALRLRREPALRAAVETWLAGTTVPDPSRPTPAWVEWEQRKHERLLATDAA